MLLLAAAAIALTGQNQNQDPPWRSDYSRIFLHPTGQNGYEEYVRAGDIIRNPAFGSYLNYEMYLARPAKDRELTPPEERPKLPEGVDPSWTLLDVQREHVRRCSSAIELVAKGNLKPVTDPRGDLTPGTIFPELATFKTLTKYAIVQMRVNLADGRPDMATRTAITMLTMRGRMPMISLISDLVGIAMDAIILASINENTERFSEHDWRQFQDIADQRLQINNYMQAMMMEEQFELSMVPLMLKSSEEASSMFGDGEDNAKIGAAIAGLNPTQRERLGQQLSSEIRTRFSALFQRLRGPEAKWAEDAADSGPEPTLTSDPASLVKVLGAFFSPVFHQATLATIKNRTQMRLLKLHSLVQLYRWHTGRLPEKLEDAAPKDFSDPVTGAPYIYQTNGVGYRLASKGVKETGEIELKYKKSPPTRDDDIPPLP